MTMRKRRVFDMDREFYIGEDGLNYCSVCREVVEVFLPENIQTYLQMKTHPRQCKCVRERNEKEARERKEREHIQTVESNTAICFEEKMMRQWNFQNDNASNPCMEYAKRFI